MRLQLLRLPLWFLYQRRRSAFNSTVWKHGVWHGNTTWCWSLYRRDGCYYVLDSSSLGVLERALSGMGSADCVCGSADIWCTQNCCIVDFLYDSKYIFRNGYLSFLFGFVINGLQEKFELSRQLHFRIIHTFRTIPKRDYVFKAAWVLLVYSSAVAVSIVLSCLYFLPIFTDASEILLR